MTRERLLALTGAAIQGDGDDVAPVGLGLDVANAYSVAVEIAEKG